jgi:hypothetical protein
MGGISREIRERVRQQAGNRCGYCHAPQFLVLGPLEIDHLLPTAAGGFDEEENLWLACSVCNSHKSQRINAFDPQSGELVPLFNPRRDSWEAHFIWTTDGNSLIGLSAIGRATIAALQINADDQLKLRSIWVEGNRFPPAADSREGY